MSEKNDFSEKLVSGKGMGLFSNKLIKNGDLVMMYEGVHISEEEAIEREDLYGAGDHCYMFFYTIRDKRDKKIVMCVDSTNSQGQSRLINHSRKLANLKPEYLNGNIWFRAKCDIQPNSELLFDYGERRKEILEANPWLKE